MAQHQRHGALPRTWTEDSSIETQRHIELKIESTAFGGKGIARVDGKVYFVEDAIEGDTVIAEITSDSGRYADAIARDILTPSALRGPSSCAFSDQCGGCQWQGVAYAQQLEWKRQFVLSSLTRIGKLSPDISCDIIPSPMIQGYRNRVFVRARISPEGRIVVGYFRRGSRDFVGIDRCMIATPRINAFFERLAHVVVPNESAQEIKFRFEIQDIPLQTDHEPHLLISVYDPDDKHFDIQKIISGLRDAGGVAYVGAPRDLSNAPFVPFDEDLGITFHTAAGLFQQVNIAHNHILRRLVKDVVDRLAPQRILDVFCGSGNLSLPLADGTRIIDGVEFSRRAIDGARLNCEKAGTQNASYYPGDTDSFLWRCAKSGEIYDMVIADPPREGMYKALVPLKKIAPKSLVYVSCDPTTLARDLGSLCKSGYKITALKALDFFPNTYHVESFVVLEREP